MEYVPPYGRESEGDTASYVNGDPSIGRQGSIPPAAAFEHPMREIVNVIDKSEFIPEETDLLQLTKSVRSQRLNWADDTGSVNNLSVSYDPPIAQYTLGLTLRVRVKETCTGAASIDAGAGRVQIKLMNGGNTSPGDLVAGGVCALCYDGTNFQLLNFFGLGGASGAETSYYINIPYAVDTSVTPNIVIATFSPAITSLQAGDPLLVKIANTNTGSSVLRVNALSDKNIVPNGGAPLLQGDMQVGDVVLFIFDGTNFFITPNPFVTANFTMSVPGQYADVPAALAVLKRKSISPTATVTIQIQGGTSGNPYVINPFQINHANSDRITIKGTMLAGAPIAGNFAQTGQAPAQRAADSANNIVMLRGRYGTEIRVLSSSPAAGVYAHGVQNVGPGSPTIQDMLITGPNFSGFSASYAIGRWMGVRVDQAQSIRCINVACWGLDNGYYGGSGILSATNCSACGLFGSGFFLTGGGGSFSLGGPGGCISVGNAAHGCFVNQNAFMGVTATCSCNGISGATAADCSELTFAAALAQNNGYPTVLDLNAVTLSEIVVIAGSGFVVASPLPNTYGNGYSVIVVPG
jgi:hypothetical protein